MANAHQIMATEQPDLRKALNEWQIFFIAVSALLGTGIFSHDGLALRQDRIRHLPTRIGFILLTCHSVAGPGALVLATAVVGIIVICFMDGLSEMIQAFPCANALVEYVRFFVDEELAVCVGIAYWGVWTMSFSLQLGAAADFTSAWSLKRPIADVIIRAAVWFCIVPLALVGINLCNVKVFGYIETGGGCLKLLIIAALSLILYYLAGVTEGLEAHTDFDWSGHQLAMPNGTHFQDGFTDSAAFPKPWANFFSVLSLVAFSWIGNEVIAVTAFEAKSLTALKLPSLVLPYLAFGIYLIAGCAAAMAVRYNNASLSKVFQGDETDVETTSPPLEFLSPVNSSGSLIVIAANQAGKFPLAHAMNACMLVSAVSNANTSLYLASRTLYGLALRDSHSKWKPWKWCATVTSQKIPGRAVWISAIFFIWLPVLSLRDIPADSVTDYTQPLRVIDQGSQQWVTTFACQCCLFVWGTECLAFIRYWYLLRRHNGSEKSKKTAQIGDSREGAGGELERDYPGLNRWGSHKVAWTLLGTWQPVPAIIGLIGCLLLLVICPLLFLVGDLSQTTGSAASKAYQVTELLAAPLLFLLLWLGLKMLRLIRPRREGEEVTWFVVYQSWGSLSKALQNLSRLSEEGSKNAGLNSSNETLDGVKVD